jgi:hypothetical protein
VDVYVQLHLPVALVFIADSSTGDGVVVWQLMD